jgi:FkbH-like protein
MVVNMCDDPSEFIEKIESIAPFYFKNITKEDFTRIKSYKSIGLLNQEKSQSKNIDDFLKNLKPKIKFEKINKDNCVRSSQLIGKTNQFKLNSKIFSSKNLLLRGEKCMPISFEDKFQNYGIIGVIVYSLHPKTKTLIIENWVMSCRVFSRRIENYIINFIIKKLKDKKYNFIKFNFEITGKNLYLQNFIEELGIKLNKKNNNYLVHFNDIVNKKKNYIINIK